MFEDAKRIWPRVVALSLVALALSGSAFAQSIADRVTVTDPYIRAVPPVVKTSAAFMQIRYDGSEEEFLIAASTPVAGAVELHMHVQDNGVMRMRKIPHIHLPPAKPVSLEPGGLHIMLFDLKATLEPGDDVPITLVFADHSTKQVTATVRSVRTMMKR